MRPITLLVLHCSASSFGDAALIDRWHRARGFQKIGYHYVILNGYRVKPSLVNKIMDCTDGGIEPGRNESEIGAHVEGYNRESIGVCLIGNGSYSDAQLTSAQNLIVAILLVKYPQARLLGHYELNPNKTCPLLDMAALRAKWNLPEPDHLPK